MPDLADIFWQILDPAGYNAMKMEEIMMKRPQLLGRKRYERAPSVEDRLSDGLLEEYIIRNQQFKEDVDLGPLSGDQLDRILIEQINMRHKLRKQSKGGVL